MCSGVSVCSGISTNPTERVTVKPVKRRRKKKKSPSALARSRKKQTRFLEKKLAGKPGLASPEGKSVTAVPSEQNIDNSLCAKELENTSLTCGRRSKRNLVSSENPTPVSESDFDEQATLLEFLDTIDSDDNDEDVSSVPVHSVCSNCKHPPKKIKIKIKKLCLTPRFETDNISSVELLLRHNE